MNKLQIFVGIVQLGAAVEAAARQNYKLAAVFVLYAGSSIILAFAK